MTLEHLRKDLESKYDFISSTLLKKMLIIRIPL